MSRNGKRPDLSKWGFREQTLCAVCREPLPDMETMETVDHHGMIMQQRYRPWTGSIQMALRVEESAIQEEQDWIAELKIRFQDISRTLCFDCFMEALRLLEDWKEKKRDE